MCGITGFLNLNNAPAQRDVLQRMNDCISHRGPDDAGFWLHENVGLAMRRLAIIDLSGGHQPLCNEDETVWIVFNGEIYNFPELRRDLESRGHRFRTHSDTECIVHAWEEWGEDCQKKLRGMFAFAIYDLKKQTLFIARDRVGKKPLLYTKTASGEFLFASEFQSLLSHPGVSRRINFQALDLFLTTGCIPSPHTAYEGIHKLPPAHSLTIQNGEIKIQRYWQLSFENKIKITEAEAKDELLRRLREAVKIRMVSEVPLGAFLSGGIDSSAVVALMAQESSTRIKTFSVGFNEREYSELPHAKRMAEKYNTEHTEIIVNPDAEAILPQLVRHFGEPYADSSAVPTFYVSQETRKHVTVALNGDGGDESFAGYERYRAMQLAEQLPPMALKIGANAANLLPAGTNFRSRSVRLKRMLNAAVLPRAERYLHYVSTFNPSQKNALYSDEFKSQCGFPQAHPLENLLSEYSHLHPVDACLLTDVNTYLPDDLLPKVDITSMANSLEARSPFLDHELMEWAATLPPDLKLRGSDGKYILRQALQELVPQENMARRKMGFGVPVGDWLRGPLKNLLHETVLSEKALNRNYFQPDTVKTMTQSHLENREDHTARLWSLMMLEMWHQEFMD